MLTDALSNNDMSVPHIEGPEADALLGKMPDQAVALRLGRTVPAVSTRRKRLGIPVGG